MSSNQSNENVLHTLQFKFDDRTLFYKDVPQDLAKNVIRSLKQLIPYLVKRAGEPYSAWKDHDSTERGAPSLIKSLRESKGWTQKELSERLEVKQYNLSRIETGNRAISKAMAKKLSDVFKIDYREFL